MTERQDSEDPTILSRLSKLETGQLSDVLDEAGLFNQVLSSDLIRRDGGGRFAARVACGSGEVIVAGRHPSPPLHQDLLETLVGAGQVLLISTGDFQIGAILGGLIAGSLARAGCAGIVTDGAVRDLEELRQLGLPVFSKSATPINGSRRFRLTKADVPVDLPGQTGQPVHISPGDYIVGDADGAVIVPRRFVLQIIEDAEQLAEIELRLAADLAAGSKRSEAFKKHPRFDHVRPARLD